MIGDNLNISIGLKKSVKIHLIEEAFLSLRNMNFIRPDTFVLKNKEPEVLTVEDDIKIICYYNQFICDYEGNDYGVPAYFSVAYYSSSKERLDYSCNMVSVSAFNHPAGELILENNEEINNQLKEALEGLGVFDLLIYTNDSIYDTPELLSKYKNKDIEGNSGILYVLK
jgi:hypothetical protein